MSPKRGEKAKSNLSFQSAALVPRIGGRGFSALCDIVQILDLVILSQALSSGAYRGEVKVFGN